MTQRKAAAVSPNQDLRQQQFVAQSGNELLHRGIHESRHAECNLVHV
jgi:hypothetical protein